MLGCQEINGVAIAPDALVIRQLKEHHASLTAGGFPALRCSTRVLWPFHIGHPPVQLRQGPVVGVVLQPAPKWSEELEAVLL